MTKKTKATTPGDNRGIRNRVVKRDRLKGSELAPHPLQWKTHPGEQLAALETVLTEVGQVGELYAYYSKRNGGKLTLIDGHGRAEGFADLFWDIGITDLTDEEADKILLTRDPIVGMADIDGKKLDELIGSCDMSDGAIAAMLAGLGGDAKAAADGDGESEPAPARYPITPVFSERYDYVIVFCKNEVDLAWLKNKLAIEQQKSYKQNAFKAGHVIPFEKFKALWESRS